MLLLFHYIKSVKLCISKIGGITEIVWFFTSRQLGPHKSATGIDFSFIFSFPLIVYQLIISSFALLCRTATALSLSLSLCRYHHSCLARAFSHSKVNCIHAHNLCIPPLSALITMQTYHQHDLTSSTSAAAHQLNRHCFIRLAADYFKYYHKNLQLTRKPMRIQRLCWNHVQKALRRDRVTKLSAIC